MSDEVEKGAADAKPAEAKKDNKAPRPRRRRRWLRPLLLIGGPLVVVIAGAWFYYSGGRYVSTENAYVKADKVAVSAEVAGPITSVAVDENTKVKKGDLLFRIEQRPYEIAVEEAKAKIAAVRQDIQSLKASYKQQAEELDLAKVDVDYAQRQYDRQSRLAKDKVVSQSTLDETENTLKNARHHVAVAKQAMQTTLAKLGGDPDVPVESTPEFQQAQAALQKAELDLAHTTVEAPFDGIAGNTPQPGQYVTPGSAVMSLVSDHDVWVDANFKETQLTYLKPGQEVDITVDTYPDHTWHGVVASISPATGSEFSVLPAQNATGNWVKVVQRVPVRIAVDSDAGGPELRAGMSSEVEVDTHHQRELPAFARTALSWFDGVAGTDVAQAAASETR